MQIYGDTSHVTFTEQSDCFVILEPSGDNFSTLVNSTVEILPDDSTVNDIQLLSGSNGKVLNLCLKNVTPCTRTFPQRSDTFFYNLINDCGSKYSTGSNHYSIKDIEPGTSYDIQDCDRTVLVDQSNVMVNLSDASACLGRILIIKNNGQSVVGTTVNPSGSQTIDESGIYHLNGAYQSVILQSDGQNWLITGGRN
jgi:hypothetical protein